MTKYLIGIDIGGTKIEASLIHKTELKILARKRIATERQKGYEQVLLKIKVLINDLCEENNISLSKLEGLGVGLPGSVHPHTQKMLTGNTALFVDRDLEYDLHTHINPSENFKIIFDNDANCFALAETYLGAGQSYYKETGISPQKQNCLGIILGTGCGSGIIIEGKIYSGKHGGAGEAGHTELITGGAPCYCGRNGCAEQYLSGPSLEASFNSRIYSQIEKHPSAKEIFELFNQKDPIAIAVVKQYQRHLAKFIGNLNNVLDLDYFVLGGGVSLATPIYQGLAEMSAEHSFIPGLKPKILRHELTESAGSLGAALLLLKK